jgi:hypothetical protein
MVNYLHLRFCESAFCSSSESEVVSFGAEADALNFFFDGCTSESPSNARFLSETEGLMGDKESSARNSFSGEFVVIWYSWDNSLKCWRSSAMILSLLASLTPLTAYLNASSSRLGCELEQKLCDTELIFK